MNTETKPNITTPTLEEAREIVKGLSSSASFMWSTMKETKEYAALQVIHPTLTSDEITKLYVFRKLQDNPSTAGIKLRPFSKVDVAFEGVGAFTIGFGIGALIGTGINMIIDSID